LAGQGVATPCPTPARSPRQAPLPARITAAILHDPGPPVSAYQHSLRVLHGIVGWPETYLFSCEDFCLSRLIFNFPAVSLIRIIRVHSWFTLPGIALRPTVLCALCVLCGYLSLSSNRHPPSNSDFKTSPFRLHPRYTHRSTSPPPIGTNPSPRKKLSHHRNPLRRNALYQPPQSPAFPNPPYIPPIHALSRAEYMEDPIP
jgi:hypothetical protein